MNTPTDEGTLGLYGLQGDPSVQQARRRGFGSGSAWTLLAVLSGLVGLLMLAVHFNLMSALLGAASVLLSGWAIWRGQTGTHTVPILVVAVSLGLNTSAAIGVRAATVHLPLLFWIPIILLAGGLTTALWSSELWGRRRKQG
jgi:hypothetical protein